MALPNIFSKEVCDSIIARINKLNATSQPKWGKMSVGQMLAHCNVTYEMLYENKHPKPNAFMRFVLKAFVKKIVVGESTYKANSQTAPAFIIKETRDFEVEKKRLIDHILQTQNLGGSHFDGRESHSFGKLNTLEWNNMFYKHLDHHLNQFAV